MKRRLSLVVFLGLFYSLYAQSPVLTRNTLVAPGTVWKMADAGYASLGVIDVSIKGENVVWDFSGLTNKDEEVNIDMYYKDPVGTAYYSDFPDANFVTIEEDYKDNNLIYSKHSYWKVTDSKLEKIGYKHLNESVVSYSDYQTELVFPMQYGSTGSDTWDNSASSYGGDVEFECVGYGTLMLPDATHQNVLMVHYVMTEVFETEMYIWYAENGATLLQYNGGFFSSGLYALQQEPTGNESIQAMTETVHYNNPVKDILNVKIEAKDNSLLNFTLVNASGNIVLKENAHALHGVNSFDFDTGNLPAGIYFLTISSTYNDKPLVLKVVRN